MSSANNEQQHHHTHSSKHGSSNKSWRYYVYMLHRNLGYLAVGLTLVYAISGILLNHVNQTGDPAFKITKSSTTLPAGLTTSYQIDSVWQTLNLDTPPLQKAVATQSGFSLYFKGGSGNYERENGFTHYEIYTKRPVIYYLTYLHVAKGNGWFFIGDLYAAILAFLAISGMFMVKGKHSIAGRGKWYLIIGVLIPVIYILLAS